MANQTLVATATENSRSEPATNCFFHLEKKNVYYEGHCQLKTEN